MFCKNCGKDTLDNSQYCGCTPIQPTSNQSDVDSASGGAAPPEQAPESPAAPPAEPPKKGKVKWFLAVISAVILVAAAVAMFPKAQLTVEDLTVPEQVESGEDFIVTVKVANTGRAKGTQTLDLAINGESYLRTDITVNDRSEERAQFHIAGITTAGDYRINVDELTADVRVLKPAEFALSSFSLEHNPLMMGEETEVAVDVSNVGEVAGSYTVCLTIDGEVRQTKEVTLAGESSATVCFTLVKDEPGNFKVGLNDLSEELAVWEIIRPANGSIFVNHLSGGSGHLIIDNGLNQDAAVILVDPSSPQEPLLSVYVRANSKHTVRSIKNGTYHIYYAVGDDWESFSQEFTGSVYYGRFEEGFKFTSTGTTYTIWSFTLHAVGDGTSTERVSPDVFPPVQ